MKHRLPLSAGFMAAATFGRLGYCHKPDPEPGTATPATPGTPPVATPPATPPPAIGAKGELGENWHLTFGDEFAPHGSQASQFKDVGSLFRSYVHLRTHGPAYPGEGATPDDIGRFRSLAQVPDKPDGYGLTKPEGFTGEWDDASIAAIAEVAHAHHVPAPALKALLAKHLEQQGAQAQAAADESARLTKEAQDALVGKWRGNYQANESTANHFADRFAEMLGIPKDDGSYQALREHPQFKEIMLKASELLAEDRTSAKVLTDLRSAQQRLDAISNGTDPEWGKKYQEGDMDAYKVWTNLYNEVHGKKA